MVLHSILDAWHYGAQECVHIKLYAAAFLRGTPSNHISEVSANHAVRRTSLRHTFRYLRSPVARYSQAAARNMYCCQWYGLYVFAYSGFASANSAFISSATCMLQARHIDQAMSFT